MHSRFSTLLLREWMQHKRGWLITLLLPPLLFLAILPFGEVEGLHAANPMLLGLAIVMISTAALFGISYSSALFQLPGLARRDQQDRSIEFWLSLPAGHSESIGATLLAHALLVPVAAAVVGFLSGGVIASALLVKQGGWSAWTSVPWLDVYGMALPLVLRGLLGVLLMTLWLSPLIMIFMAASAWLKRWGVPAVVITVSVAGLVLDKLYGNPIVWALLQSQIDGSNRAFLANPKMLGHFGEPMGDDPQMAINTGSWALHDALAGIQNLASAHFLVGLLVAGGCFALLVLKRRRAS